MIDKKVNAQHCRNSSISPAIKQGITKEHIQMEKIWKEREKQLEKVLLSTSGMYGSVKGIAGASVGDIPLLEGTGDETEEGQ
jgi:hypothetical protein